MTKFRTGVYCFYNKVTGKRYVGSAAISLRKRLQWHVLALEGGYHRNRYFQRAWNKYGRQSFRIYILERCASEYCVSREQYWMDIYQCSNRRHGYNLSPTAGSNLGVKFSRSDEQRRKLGERSKGNSYAVGAVRTEEFKRRLAEAKREYWRTRAKLTDSQVDAIRQRYVKRCKVNGAGPLSEEFGVTARYIRRVVGGDRRRSTL